MLITDRIARMIEAMLDSQNGIAEIRRNEFASEIGCVPSQINYVITSRFNKERGYIVESRRGGGGYIKIIRPNATGAGYLYHMLASVGDGIDAQSAVYLVKDMLAKSFITEREALILMSVLGNRTVYGSDVEEDRCNRAELFKEIILNIIRMS